MFLQAPNKIRSSAFTLVETVLAIGIVSFAFMAILGLLPCGLQTFRKAMDATLEGQIAQHLVGQISQTPYDGLADLQGQTYSFDDNGNAVATDSPDGVYTASIALNEQTALPGSPNYSNDSLVGVSITFKRKGSTASAGPGKTFVTYVAAKSRAVTP